MTAGCASSTLPAARRSGRCRQGQRGLGPPITYQVDGQQQISLLAGVNSNGGLTPMPIRLRWSAHACALTAINLSERIVQVSPGAIWLRHWLSRDAQASLAGECRALLTACWRLRADRPWRRQDARSHVVSGPALESTHLQLPVDARRP